MLYTETELASIIKTIKKYGFKKTGELNCAVESTDDSNSLYKFGPETNKVQTLFFKKPDSYSIVVTKSPWIDSSNVRHQYTVYVAGWDVDDESFYPPTSIFNYINPMKLHLYLANDENIRSAGPSFEAFVNHDW